MKYSPGVLYTTARAFYNFRFWSRGERKMVSDSSWRQRTVYVKDETRPPAAYAVCTAGCLDVFVEPIY